MRTRLKGRLVSVGNCLNICPKLSTFFRSTSVFVVRHSVKSPKSMYVSRGSLREVEGKIAFVKFFCCKALLSAEIGRISWVTALN